MPIYYEQTLCDAKEWHDKERGIEARRTLGILCYIAKESDYLCEYIAGKCELNIKNDESYKRYSKQMIRYSEWSTVKQYKYEILEIILQIVTALNYVVNNFFILFEFTSIFNLFVGNHFCYLF